jgi:hypothetical protein
MVNAQKGRLTSQGEELASVILIAENLRANQFRRNPARDGLFGMASLQSVVSRSYEIVALRLDIMSVWLENIT